MRNLFAVLSNIFTSLRNLVITRDFKLEGYTQVAWIFPFPFDIWNKDGKYIVRYMGKEWKRQRNQFSLEHHGMSWKEWMKPENADLRIAKDVVYIFDTP